MTYSIAISLSLSHVRELCPASPQRLQRLCRCVLVPACAPPRHASSCISLSTLIWIASSRPSAFVKVPYLYIRFFWRFLRRVAASLAFCRLATYKRSKTAECIISLAPLVSWLSDLSIKVGELFWCLWARSQTSAIWEPNLAALLGVLDSHWATSIAGGVGVRSLTSSFNNTVSGLNGTKPVPRKPA